MEAGYYAILALGAFWLGACPFSLWVGHLFLGKDIRDYGDGNPGAANVYRAGGRKSLALALALDMGKGMPFVVLSHTVLDFPAPVVLFVALSAVLGHAFSPFLHLRGGKALAVTYGVFMVLPHRDILVVSVISIALGFLLSENDAWVAICGPAGALVYVLASRGNSWEGLFLALVVAVFIIKNLNDILSVPRPQPRLVHWIQSRRR